MQFWALFGQNDIGCDVANSDYRDSSAILSEVTIVTALTLLTVQTVMRLVTVVTALNMEGYCDIKYNSDSSDRIDGVDSNYESDRSDSENVTYCVILSKLINSHQADEKNTDHLKWILMT